MPVTGTKSIGRRAAIPPGKPALVLHGGPASGCSAGSRRPFDPDVYRIVLFDQRGSGRSAPHATDPNIDLSTNTTAHLLADMELLRRLDIERWLVFGGFLGIDPGARLRRTAPIE
jgi:proline iminopeptidase